MPVKYIEEDNPFVAGGTARYKVERETKLYYVVRYNERAVGYWKKHPLDKDGSFVKRRGAGPWDRRATLRIVEDG